MLKWIVLLLVVAGGAGAFYVLRERARSAPPPPPENVAVAGDTYALLVGCTEYPELQKVSDPAIYESNIRLLGPGNDVALMESVLRRYLGVPEANIRVLTGWPESLPDRPTRANILGALDRLAEEVPAGAHVLFLYAGHGSQQPDEVGGDEADGRDEVLVPADGGRWDPVQRKVGGVITDDEIRSRLVAIRDAGATVWALFDCCHSGTLMRGGVPGSEPEPPDFGEVRLRSLPPGILGIPDDAYPLASRGTGELIVGGVLPQEEESLGGICAIYAARSWEQAPEMVLPRNRFAANRQPHGLCTFQVARALQHYGGGLSIAEIFNHVLAAYAALPWSDATPVSEGDDSLRALPGRGRADAALLLRAENGRILVDAGSLQGLTVGSVLSVYRPGGFGDPDALLCRVSLTEVDPLCSTCGPVEGGLEVSQIPHGAPAEVVEVAPGGPPLRLSLVDVAGRAQPASTVQRLRDVIAPDARTRAQFPLVEPALADWLVRDLPIGSDEILRFVLEPARPERGIQPLEVTLGDLASALNDVRRAENLRAYARSGPLSGLPEGFVVEAQYRRIGTDTPEPWVPGVELIPGDRILLRLANGTQKDIDVTIKNLDAAQREYHVWPPGAPSRRLSREDSQFVEVDELELTDDGLGLESLLIVTAVLGEGAEALDVGALTGSSVRARDNDLAARQAEHALMEALRPEGTRSRGLGSAAASAVGIDEVVWRSTWGRIGYPSTLNELMTPLDPPLQASLPSPAGTPTPGGNPTWHHAIVLPGDAEKADVLLLSGMQDGEGTLGILVDADGDAGFRATDPVEAVHRAAAGELPVELWILSQAGRSVAAYPRTPGDTALGSIRIESDVPDRAGWQWDLTEDVWVIRETCGSWLSTSFVPSDAPDPMQERGLILRALRRFFRTR